MSDTIPTGKTADSVPSRDVDRSIGVLPDALQGSIFPHNSSSTDLASLLRQLETFSEISQRLTETRTLANVLDVVYDGVRVGLGYDRVGINLFDYQAGTFEDLIGTDRDGNKYVPTDRVIVLDADSPIWSIPGIAAILRGSPYYYTEDAGAECPPELLYLYDGAPKHNIQVPLRVGDTVCGMISVDNLTSGRPIDRVEVETLISLAAHVSRSIENARLLDALQKSEASFRLLFADNPLPMWVYDLETSCFLEVNQAAIAQYGYSREEFIATPVTDTRLGQDIVGLGEYVSSLNADPQPSNGWHHRLADGSVIDVEITSHPLPFGVRAAALVIVRDVTAERRAAANVAEALARTRDAETRYRALVEQIPAVVYRSGPDLSEDATYISPAVRSLLGCTPEEFVGTPDSWMSFVHPEDRARVRHANEESDRTSRPFSQEYRVVARDGTVKWVRDDGVCIKDAEGRPVYWQGSWLDVTEQKQAVEELHASETRFRSMFKHALIGMSLVRPDGRWIEVNGALCSLVGYTEEELLARSFQDITHPDDLDADLAYVRRLLDGEIDSYRMEKRYIHRNGETLWVLLSVSLVRRDDGEPLYCVAQIQDITQQKRSDEELRHQALHDALTGLPNRTLMQDRLEQALISARRSSDTVALLVMDLNRFKEVNDSLGHAAGDRLLQETTARLTSSLRQSDTVARLGGDEFAIILPDSGGQQAEHTARKLLLALRQPIMLHDHQIDVDASIGIALFPEHGESADTLLRHADVAMYAAKRSRRGHSLYAAEHDMSSPGQLALVAGLRDAIEHEKMLLHFQPIVSLSTGRVKAMEALARWQPDGQGFVPPSQFIPLAEETGLIEPLTMLVLRQALAQCAVWKRAGLDLSVAINLSASSLLNANLSEVIETALQHAGVGGESLMVEVTESALMAKPEEVAAVLDRLHRLGIRVAIDDFGIGYSSLSYLQQLPVDEIKIDRSFIQTMAHDEQAIVRTVIELGKNLNLEVTAEGVEDEETWRTLHEMNCSTVQGYYISRPMPAAAVAAWIASYEQHPRRPGP